MPKFFIKFTIKFVIKFVIYGSPVQNFYFLGLIKNVVFKSLSFWIFYSTGFLCSGKASLYHIIDYLEDSEGTYVFIAVFESFKKSSGIYLTLLNISFFNCFAKRMNGVFLYNYIQLRLLKVSFLFIKYGIQLILKREGTFYFLCKSLSLFFFVCFNCWKIFWFTEFCRNAAVRFLLCI